jgi:hypothetical protein
MAEAAAGTPIIRLAPGEDVHLDVDFCDVVPPNRGETDPSVRFKGRVVAGARKGELVRVFVDASAAEVPMTRHGVLRGALPELADGETAAPVALARKRLTIHRVQGKNQITWFDIRPREGVIAAEDERLLADYHWAFAQARNEIAPLLQRDGYPVGAAELLTIADTLFHARRRDRLTRG